jgi:hypothetical protein
MGERHHSPIRMVSNPNPLPSSSHLFTIAKAKKIPVYGWNWRVANGTVIGEFFYAHSKLTLRDPSSVAFKNRVAD